MSLTKMKNRLGWAKDQPDPRDYKFPTLPKVPTTKVDLRLNALPVYDQGNLGSCTANAIAAAYQFDLLKAGLPSFIPSRLFIYYNTRLIEGTVNVDAGAYIRDGIKTIAEAGACTEMQWPYNVQKFAVRPDRPSYTSASAHRAVLYRRVTQSLDQMKAVLDAGYPFTIGFLVYSSFYNAGYNGGIVTMPRRGEQLLGGHAVLVMGYDNTKNVFIVRNSWGTGWGDGGYFYVPYAYFTSATYASDLWVITSITG